MRKSQWQVTRRLPEITAGKAVRGHYNLQECNDGVVFLLGGAWRSVQSRATAVIKAMDV